MYQRLVRMWYCTIVSNNTLCRISIDNTMFPALPIWKNHKVNITIVACGVVAVWMNKLKYEYSWLQNQNQKYFNSKSLCDDDFCFMADVWKLCCWWTQHSFMWCLSKEIKAFRINHLSYERDYIFGKPNTRQYKASVLDLNKILQTLRASKGHFCTWASFRTGTSSLSWTKTSSNCNSKNLLD